MPETIPDDDPIVAWAGVLLLHVPPGVTSDKVTDEPTHTERVPPMAAGKGLTLTVAVAVQPLGSV
jgi:hypothetical protein